MRHIVSSILGLVISVVIAGSVDSEVDAHHCSDEALASAHRLLEFHIGADDRIEIEDEVTQLAPVRNPAADDQHFDVLEVWGFVYRGTYQMRFLYAQIPGECILMGQEIVEHADL